MAENETKNVEETTSTQEVSPEDSKKTEEAIVADDNFEKIDKKELETLRKKAGDFDGMIEANRLKKLAKREETKVVTSTDEVDVDAIVEKAKEAALEVVQSNNQKVYDENLTQAYRNVKATHKWIDDDEIISNISKSFHPGGSLSVEDLTKKLEATLINLYPDKYKSSIEESIKAKVLAGEKNIADGGGSGVSEQKLHKDDDVVISKEDQRIADKFFGGDIQRYLKRKKD